MPLDVVAAERLAGTKRRLDVDRGSGLEPSERRPGEGLRDGVEGDRSVLDRDRGQTAAVERDGVADGSRRSRRGSLDDEASAFV